MNPLHVGAQVPHFTGIDDQGNSWSSADYKDKKLILIMAMMNTKDSKKFLNPFVNLAGHVIAIKIPNSENFLSPNEIKQSAETQGILAITKNDLYEALEHTKSLNGKI